MQAAFLALLAAPAAKAGVVTVLADGGSGSLRAAVAEGGTVTFASGLAGTITLSGGQIVVPNGTTISGPGADRITVKGAGSRLFDVGTGVTAAIGGLTLSGGSAGAGQVGGAIRNGGNLTLDGVAVDSNAAGDAGGGVFNSGQLAVRNSLFNANAVVDGSCAGGGAIRSQGAGSSLDVVNSTFTANTAASCSGGGISFNGGTAVVAASTITGNSAGASGGNLYKGSSAAVLTLKTTVVADGSAPVNADLHGATAGLVSGGYNLVRARGDSTGYVATDLPDGTDPGLSALAGNGGTTRTRLPLSGSPLREAFSSNCGGSDQRGFARPQGMQCDIGAVEYRHHPLTAQVLGGGKVSAGATPAPTFSAIADCAGTCVAYYDGEVQPTVTLTATPDAGWTFSDWDGACGGANPVTTVTLAGARTCVAKFVPTAVTVTPSVSGGHGTISPDTPQMVPLGGSVGFTLAPDPRYHIGDVASSCGGSLAGDVFTTGPVTADCSVVASFAIDTHAVGGNVSGLVGSSLVLRLNGTHDLPVAANGAFAFGQPVDDLGPYEVTIAQQPVSPAQQCTVANGSGVVDGSDVTNVLVTCAPPPPHLVVSVADGRDYARYGMLLNYVVTVANDGEGAATGVTVRDLQPPQLDASAATWVCSGATGAAHCTPSGTGALHDAAVTIPAGQTLTWLVSAPVRVDAPGDRVDYTVEASGPATGSATDADVLVLLRTGFDVADDDGAESGGGGFACDAPGAPARVLDPATTLGIDLPAASTGPIDVALEGRASGGAGFRVERLNLGTPQLRLVAVGTDGTERASAWSAAKAEAPLLLALAVEQGRASLLLEGTTSPLDVMLPDAAPTGFRVVANPRACR